jgi:hypothetical protein
MQKARPDPLFFSVPASTTPSPEAAIKLLVTSVPDDSHRIWVGGMVTSDENASKPT